MISTSAAAESLNRLAMKLTALTNYVPWFGG